jgi:hypothetical protein
VAKSTQRKPKTQEGLPGSGKEEGDEGADDDAMRTSVSQD